MSSDEEATIAGVATAAATGEATAESNTAPEATAQSEVPPNGSENGKGGVGKAKGGTKRERPCSPLFGMIAEEGISNNNQAAPLQVEEGRSSISNNNSNKSVKRGDAWSVASLFGVFGWMFDRRNRNPIDDEETASTTSSAGGADDTNDNSTEIEKNDPRSCSTQKAVVRGRPLINSIPAVAALSEQHQRQPQQQQDDHQVVVVSQSSPSSKSSSSTFNVVFRPGPLGLNLIEKQSNGSSFAVVKDVNLGGAAAALQKIQRGDRITKVNGRAVTSFYQAVVWLKNANETRCVEFLVVENKGKLGGGCSKVSGGNPGNNSKNNNNNPPSESPTDVLRVITVRAPFLSQFRCFERMDDHQRFCAIHNILREMGIRADTLLTLRITDQAEVYAFEAPTSLYCDITNLILEDGRSDRNDVFAVKASADVKVDSGVEPFPAGTKTVPLAFIEPDWAHTKYVQVAGRSRR